MPARLARVKGGRSPAQRTLEARRPGDTLAHGRMRRSLHPAMKAKAAHAGAHRLRLSMDSSARTRSSHRPLSAARSACAMRSIFLRWWIEVTKPGKTRGLVSVSSPCSGPSKRRFAPLLPGR